MKLIKLWSLLLVGAVSAGVMAAPVSAASREDASFSEVDVDGRLVYVYCSSKANGYNPSNMIYLLAPDGQDPREFANTSGWLQTAEENRAVLVLPTAENATWDVSGVDQDQNEFTDETDFMISIYNNVRTNTPSPEEGDPWNIWMWETLVLMVGYDEGAVVAGNAALECPNRFAGVVMVNGQPTLDPETAGAVMSDGFLVGNKADYDVKRSDVPVAVWSLNDSLDDKYVSYWNTVNSSGGITMEDGVTVYANEKNPAEQLRTSASLDDIENSADYLWNNFLNTIIRWKNSPDGTLATYLPKEVVEDYDGASPYSHETFTVPGESIEREYLVYVPEQLEGKENVPVVLSLHGRFEPAWIFSSKNGWNELADETGEFIVVYPMAPEHNFWSIFDEYEEKGYSKFDAADLKSFSYLKDDLVNKYHIDVTRTYLTGFSMGSDTTYQLGMGYPELFAAISPSNGCPGKMDDSEMWSDAAKEDTGSVTYHAYSNLIDGDYDLPIFAFAGDNDGIVSEGAVNSAWLNTVQFFIEANGGTAVATTSEPPYGLGWEPSRVVTDYPYEYSDRFATYVFENADGNDWTQYTVMKNMPHGAITDETRAAWEFLSRFSRNEDGTIVDSAVSSDTATAAVETFNMEEGGEFQMLIPDKDLSAGSIPMIVYHVDDKEKVGQTIEELGLTELAYDNSIMITFVYPQNGSWQESDLAYLEAVNVALVNNREINEKGFPDTHRTLRYAVAMDTQSGEILCNYVAEQPLYYAGVLLNGVEESAAPKAEMPAWLMACGNGVKDAFASAANVTLEETASTLADPAIYQNEDNNAVQIFVSDDLAESSPAEQVRACYEELFKHIRRWPTTATGDVTDTKSLEELGFEAYKANAGDGYVDTSVGEWVGTALENREWYVAIPESVKEDPETKVPLLVSNHGAWTHSLYHAEQVRWHELGEECGFVVIYTKSLGSAWALDDDEAYEEAIIQWAIDNYPIDTSRIYLGGFSSGCQFTQDYALRHPTQIAAIAPFSLLKYSVPSVEGYEEILQNTIDSEVYMPMFFSIGTNDYTLQGCIVGDEEAEANLSTWFQVNHVAEQEFSAEKDSFLGLEGDRTYHWGTDKDTDPEEGRFTTNVFYTNGNPEQDYLYISYAQDLPHAVDLRQTPAAWEFLSRFSRNEDGTLNDSKN